MNAKSATPAARIIAFAGGTSNSPLIRNPLRIAINVPPIKPPKVLFGLIFGNIFLRPHN